MSDWRTNRVLGLTYGEATWLAVGVVLLAYELWAIVTRDGDVLTRAWRANSLRWIVLPVGSGILMGHLNGPALPYFSRWAPVLFVVLALAAFLHGLLARTEVPESYRAVLFGLGFVVGVIAWSGRP